MKYYLITPFLLLLVSSLNLSWAQPPEMIRYVQGDIHQRYEAQLLQLALDLTEPEFGPAKLQQATNPRVRFELALAQGQFDVGYFSASDSRNKQLLPIKVPILQGMLGYRLLLIRPESATKLIP